MNRSVCEMCAVGQRPAGVGGRGRQQNHQGGHHTRPQQQLSDFVLPMSSGRTEGDGSSSAGGSSGRSSRRGRDASHLLNFQPLPLPAATPLEAPPPRRQLPRAVAPTRSTYNMKVQHLRAKYHLLVAPGGDYRAHSLDPNYPMEWSCVRAVRLVTDQPIRCPICLMEPPLCPQIYQCSHMLCLPCALRLHASCTESGVACKCPLCAEHVDLDDLRSVCLVSADPIRPTPPSAPASSSRTSRGANTPSPDGVRFAKLHLFAPAAAPPCATVSTVDDALATGPKLLGFTQVRSYDQFADAQLSKIALARREAKDEAAAVAAACGARAAASKGGGAGATGGGSSNGAGAAVSGTERPRTAADVLRASTRPAESFPALAPSAPVGAAPRDAPEPPADMAELEDLVWLDAAETLVQSRRAAWAEADRRLMGAGGTPATQAGAVEGAPSAVGIAAAGEGTAEGVEDGAEEVGRLVLQAADGQLVFADALSARMLLDEYGSWSGVPAEICAPVLELTSHSMSDEATRRRFKSLSHLPTSSSFQVAELDLTRAVSEAVLGRAHEQLARRAERRQKKADEERATELAARREREKDARRHGRSALAFELEMMSLDDVAKARRRQELMSQAALPAVEVAPEWEEQWRQQQEAAAARQQVSFATMALKGFGATGPALGAASSPELGPVPRSPSSGPVALSPRSPRTSRTPDASPSMWPAPMSASPPTAELPPLSTSPMTSRGVDAHASLGGGTSLLRGAGASSAPPPQPSVIGFNVASQSVDATDEESAPPPLSAGWAHATQATAPSPGGAGTGGGKKSRKQKGVTLISNSSGGRN